MATSGISGTSSTSSSTSSLAASGATIAGNFDTFLSILTTQLKNQNPLDPMDTNQFTAQLVQFSSVEQQLKTNTFLEALMKSGQTASNSDAVNYIGKQVDSQGNTTSLTSDGATWSFNADSLASDATVTIKNAQGNVVYTETGSLAKGEGKFQWDGKSSSGQQQEAGSYSITIDAKNLAGQAVAVTTSASGVVSGVDLTGDEPVFTVGNNKVKLSQITAVRTAGTS